MRQKAGDTHLEVRFVEEPVDLHRADAGHVGDPHRTPGAITIRLGYGGPAVDYALEVHETMGRRYRRPGSGAAYLRGPVDHMGSKMQAIVGKHVKKAL